jgi:hypothetical protein
LQVLLRRPARTGELCPTCLGTGVIPDPVEEELPRQREERRRKDKEQQKESERTRRLAQEYDANQERRRRGKLAKRRPEPPRHAAPEKPKETQKPDVPRPVSPIAGDQSEFDSQQMVQRALMARVRETLFNSNEWWEPWRRSEYDEGRMVDFVGWKCKKCGRNWHSSRAPDEPCFSCDPRGVSELRKFDDDQRARRSPKHRF